MWTKGGRGIHEDVSLAFVPHCLPNQDLLTTCRHLTVVSHKIRPPFPRPKHFMSFLPEWYMQKVLKSETFLESCQTKSWNVYSNVGAGPGSPNKAGKGLCMVASAGKSLRSHLSMIYNHRFLLSHWNMGYKINVHIVIRIYLYRPFRFIARIINWENSKL